MRLLTTVAGLRTYLDLHQGQKIGFVPTMGALHLGHVRLIERAVCENDLAIVSIFVNPLQFAPTEDLDKYPRQLAPDCQICEQSGVDVVFAPNVNELGINDSSVTTVVPSASMTACLCGAFRSQHFTGVATIVLKLLNLVKPDCAYFGEKDAQQLAIIRRLVSDLNLSVEICGCPTIRESSGLAYSSRNQYLNALEREQASVLYGSLFLAQKAFYQGKNQGSELKTIVTAELVKAPLFQIQYIELVDPDSLEPLQSVESQGLLAIAGYFGSTRLIDNIILRNRQPIIAIDGPAGAGKSTVTRRVAQSLGLIYLDTGAMYRAVTWLVMQSGNSLDDQIAIAELVNNLDLELILSNSPEKPTQVYIQGENVTEIIRTPQVTANVSQISAQPAVRRELVKKQRSYGKKGGTVAEGRDIGTNVFADAELKIFLTATVKERANRRWLELQNQGHQELSIEQLERDIEERDYLDSTRQIAPLRKANDAVEIVTDGLSIEAVTEKIISLYQELVKK